jgi:hypothetical protein
MFSPIKVIRRVVKEARLREKYEGAPKPLTPITPVKPVKPLKVPK